VRHIGKAERAALPENDDAAESFRRIFRNFFALRIQSP